MSYTSSSPNGLLLYPKNGDGTGIVDISGSLEADVVYAPGTIVRMTHVRQSPNSNLINNTASFIPIKINSASTLVCEAYFSYYSNGINNTYAWTVTLSGINESVSSAKDFCTIHHLNPVGGGGGRRSGRPLIITKDIAANTNDTFQVSLTTNLISTAIDTLYGEEKITFIFFQIAK